MALDGDIAWFQAFLDLEWTAAVSNLSEHDDLVDIRVKRELRGLLAEDDRSLVLAMKGLNGRGFRAPPAFWAKAPERLAGLRRRNLYAVSRGGVAPSAATVTAWVGGTSVAQDRGNVWQRLHALGEGSDRRLVAIETRCQSCAASGGLSRQTCSECTETGWVLRAGQLRGQVQVSQGRVLQDPVDPASAALLAQAFLAPE